jgi:hypothetical protein
MKSFRENGTLLARVAVMAFVAIVILCAGSSLWPVQERYKGRTMEQWLRVLASEPGRSGSPLDITRVHVDTKRRTTVEVPLSFDLLREHNILREAGRICLVIDGGQMRVETLRGTNGNCLIPLPLGLPPGLHQVAVDFTIWPGPDKRMHAKGSERAVTVDDSFPSY